MPLGTVISDKNPVAETESGRWMQVMTEEAERVRWMDETKGANEEHVAGWR